MPSELKPCPFCKSATFTSYDGDVASKIEWSANCCNAPVCGATIEGFATEAQAIEAWNHRSAPTASPAKCVKCGHDKSKFFDTETRSCRRYLPQLDGVTMAQPCGCNCEFALSIASEQHELSQAHDAYLKLQPDGLSAKESGAFEAGWEAGVAYARASPAYAHASPACDARAAAEEMIGLKRDYIQLRSRFQMLIKLRH